MMYILLFIALFSPLCTLSALWQKKEWRIDRLREHMRAHGWFSQCMSTSRLIVVILGIITEQITVILIVLALMSIVQIVLKKQRYPVWTGKAMIVMGVAVVITGIISSWQLAVGNWLPVILLPLLQSVILYIAWLLFLPLDRYCKSKIMQKAAALRETFEKITVIGITGSVGKTTTKELLTHILQSKNVLATPAYVNSDMGVAQWLLRELPKKNPEEQLILIVEMGAYRMGEITLLCRIAQPHIGIITFIGTQHIALFGSQENLCKAKGELVACIPSDGHVFLNGDNELCAKMKEKSVAPITTIGTGGHADIEAYEIEEAGDGIHFRIDDTRVICPLHGTHNVTNVLLALAASTHLGIPLAESASAVQSFTPPHNTFSVRSENGVTILDDTHNASPESFRASLAWAKSQPSKRIVLMTPGLIELGVREDRIHRDLGVQAKGIVDRVIFTGTNGAQSFAEGFDKPVEQWTKTSQPIEKGDLLLCIGRISPDVINRLLPP